MPEFYETTTTKWGKIKAFLKKAIPYQEHEYFELEDSRFVTVYTKWFGCILDYSIFQIYKSTTIVSNGSTVEEDTCE